MALPLAGLSYGAEEMKITITIEDTEDGEVDVTERRMPGDDEREQTVKSATAWQTSAFESSCSSTKL